MPSIKELNGGNGVKTRSKRIYVGSLMCTAWLMALSGCTSFPPAEMTQANQRASVAAQANAVPSGYYRANRNDSLISIARAFGYSPAELANWNRLPSSDAQPVEGEVLRVAPPGDSTAAATVHVDVGDSQNAGDARERLLEWPLQSATVSEPFKIGGSRKGVVLRGKPGDAVMAAADGRVIYAGTGLKRYGSLIIIKHNATLVTGYAHLGALQVRENQSVHKGQVIGRVGAGDQDDGTFEFNVFEKNRPVDPIALLAKANR
ncbi:murein hydrolase activator EnvC family protein [Burkholderia ubonensis]|uniref:murein hydrolase activator EnvC family protein n=1 Tax=Burkholderia ubonensis TaxID=101571 RepID=UPI0009B412B4|nr:peptidoglycan DD-metalloendopeptidase family protein [Burkholderia ubonensis]